MRVSKIDQMNAFIWRKQNKTKQNKKNDQPLFLHIENDFFLKNIPFNLINF